MTLLLFHPEFLFILHHQLILPQWSQLSPVSILPPLVSGEKSARSSKALLNILYLAKQHIDFLVSHGSLPLFPLCLYLSLCFSLPWWLSWWRIWLPMQETCLSAGDLGSSPRLGRSPGEGHGNPLQYSCLENSMARGAWWVIVHGVARVRHNWTTKLSYTIFRHFHPSLFLSLLLDSRHWRTWIQSSLPISVKRGVPPSQWEPRPLWLNG